MQAKIYLENKLQTCAQYVLTEADTAFLEKEGIEAYIYKKLTSKKFRKWALNDSSEKQIKHAIHLNVASNKPILFTFPFGGYKLWRLPTTPEVDWAEFFSLAYYVNWIAPIATAYQPGVHFIFSSDDVIVGRLDNIPPDDTNAYFASFQKLIAYFSSYFPSNVKVEIRRVGDVYTQEEFETELEQEIETMTKVYEKPDPERYKNMLRTSALNYQWDGIQDMTKLTEQEKENYIKMGPIIHDAYVSLAKRRDFVRADNAIVTFTTPIPNAIALGTTKTSIAKFWMGYGVLEQRDDAFADRILSPDQLHTVAKMTHETEAIDGIDLENLTSIDIYKKLDFTSQASL
jgi:hypothetical protein